MLTPLPIHVPCWVDPAEPDRLRFSASHCQMAELARASPRLRALVLSHPQGGYAWRQPRPKAERRWLTRADCDRLHAEAVSKMIKPKAPAPSVSVGGEAGAYWFTASEWAEIQADPFLSALL